MLTQSELVLGLDAFGTHLVNLVGENFRRRGRAVNAVGLDGDQNTTSGLEEPASVHGNDTGLVGLGNISKDDINHGDNHAVAVRLAGILDNGDNVSALGSHADEVTAGTRRELDGVDETGGTNDVGDVRDRGTGGTTDVENTRAWPHVDVIGTTGNGGAKLASEGVPGTVLDLGRSCRAIVVLLNLVDRDSLLAVNRLARSDIAGRDTILLAATDDEDTGVTVRLLGCVC